MTEADMKETLGRAREALARHLCDLMDEVDEHDGRISSRKLLGGIHETLESMTHLDSVQEPAAKAK